MNGEGADLRPGAADAGADEVETEPIDAMEARPEPEPTGTDPTVSPEVLGAAEPAAAPTTFSHRRLSPNVRWVWAGGSAVGWLMITMGVLVLDLAVLPTPSGVVTSVASLVTIGFSVWRVMSRYERWSWELDEHDLVLDFGVVFHLQRLVPRSRIQHVDLASGPIDRALGLRRLRVYTAGTREAAAEIPGLEADEAERLRQALIGRS